MGRGGTILGVIGLILSASGLGLGGYAWITLSGLQNQVTRLSEQLSGIQNQVTSLSEQSTWYKYNETAVACNPGFQVTFSGLNIEFELGLNDSVYFSFMAQAHLEPHAAWSQITVYLKVDGIIDSVHYTTVGLYNNQYGNLMISLQHNRYGLSLGEHNVNVVIVGTSSGNYIYHSSLFVQKVPM